MIDQNKINLLKQKLIPKQDLLINGKWTSSKSETVTEITSPIDGKPLTSITLANEIDVNVYEKHTFRSNPECMSCHATLDGMSATLRNIAVKELGNGRYMDSDLTLNIPTNSGAVEKTFNEFSSLNATSVLSIFDPTKFAILFSPSGLSSSPLLLYSV